MCALLCISASVGQRRPLVLIAIPSGIANSHRRPLVRQMLQLMPQSVVHYKFLVPRCNWKNRSPQQRLLKDLHGEMKQGDIDFLHPKNFSTRPCTYNDLPHVVESALSWCLKYEPQPYFIIKMDDDTMVSPYTLMAQLIMLPQRDVYLGQLLYGKYHQGGFYMFSRDVLEKLLVDDHMYTVVLNETALPHPWAEDNAVGAALSMKGVDVVYDCYPASYDGLLGNDGWNSTDDISEELLYNPKFSMRHPVAKIDTIVDLSTSLALHPVKNHSKWDSLQNLLLHHTQHMAPCVSNWEHGPLSKTCRVLLKGIAQGCVVRRRISWPWFAVQGPS